MESAADDISEYNDRPSERDPTRILPVRQGKLPAPHDSSAGNLTVGIVCESWPVWLFGLQALPCKISQVWLGMISAPWLHLLQARYPSVPFVCGAPFTPQGEQLMFVHSSSGWLQLFVHHLPPTLPLVVSLMDLHDPTADFSTLCRFSMCAVPVGSMVHGSWYFLSRQFDPLQVPPLSCYPRQLKHIIDPTERHMPYRPVPSSTECVPSTHIYRHQLHTAVLCPCVYAPRGFVWRSLSNRELARAFDLPSSICSCVLDQHPSALPWLASPPIKLIHGIASFFLSCVVSGGGGR
jgi:hypothetical protein